MSFHNFPSWVREHKSTAILIALLLIFGGIDLLLNPPKGQGIEFFGIPLLAVGIFLVVLAFWPEEGLKARLEKKSLGASLLNFLSLNGKLRPYFPIIGAVIIVADLLYNIFLSATPGLLTHDTVVLLLGSALIVYNFVPEKYGKERDFALLFFIFLVLILVIPLLLARAFLGNFEESVNLYSAYMLAPQVSFFLNLLGIKSSVDWINLAFTTARGQEVIVGITTACSGIYSFGIFASAFIAFVFTEYKKIDLKVLALLALGIFTAYLANILRMVTIILVGYYYDTPETNLQFMLQAHSNAGWIIFLGWIALFWLLVFKFLVKREKVEEIKPRASKGVRCGICGEILKIDLPGMRCQCGKFYHVMCIESLEHCPSCNTRVSTANPFVDNPFS